MANRLIDIINRSKQMAEAVKSINVAEERAIEEEAQYEEQVDDTQYDPQIEEEEAVDVPVFYRGTIGKVDEFVDELRSFYNS